MGQLRNRHHCDEGTQPSATVMFLVIASSMSGAGCGAWTTVWRLVLFGVFLFFSFPGFHLSRDVKMIQPLFSVGADEQQFTIQKTKSRCAEKSSKWTIKGGQIVFVHL
jgi:hypothetical protein